MTIDEAIISLILLMIFGLTVITMMKFQEVENSLKDIHKDIKHVYEDCAYIILEEK